MIDVQWKGLLISCMAVDSTGDPSTIKQPQDVSLTGKANQIKYNNLQPPYRRRKSGGRGAIGEKKLS